MQAEVLVDGQSSSQFVVHNGTRQGCVIAPTLFNLYFNVGDYSVERALCRVWC